MMHRMTRLGLRATGITLGYLALAPLALAQAQTNTTTNAPVDRLGGVLLSFIYFFDTYLVPFIFALAFIFFLWGTFRYFILGGTNEEQRDKGKQLMLWGLIGFFVMVSVWGLVNLFVSSFGFGGQQRPDLPTFRQSSAVSAPSTSSLS